VPRSPDLIGEDRRAVSYLLSQEALDELPRVYSDPTAERAEEDTRSQIDRLGEYIAYNVPGEPSRSEGAVDCAIRLLGDYLRHRAEWWARSAEGRAQVDQLVEQAADLRRVLEGTRRERDSARTERDDALRQLAVAEATIRSDAEATEEQADALRAEVARLTGLLDESERRRRGLFEEFDEIRTGRDEARQQVVDLGRQLAEQRSLAAARAGTADNLRHLIGAHEPQTSIVVSGPGTVTCDGHELRVTYDPAVAARAILADHDLAQDPRRPRLDMWPDDAVTLTYPELRRLVALHLDRYCEPGSGRAMREGDVPLRLSEVLDR
jgi:hypothetical protein